MMMKTSHQNSYENFPNVFLDNVINFTFSFLNAIKLLIRKSYMSLDLLAVIVKFRALIPVNLLHLNII